MKKLFVSIFLIISILVPFSAIAARIGDVVNSTLYTDIIASINNYNIESYNIDGYTAIVAEDLAEFGFNVSYDNTKRSLYIKRGNTNTVTSTYVASQKDKNKIGTKMYDVLYTDIITYLNGKVIPSYNIGGRTIIYINALEVYGQVTYDNERRRIDVKINDGLSSKAEYLLEVCEPYRIYGGETYKSSEGENFVMCGKNYTNGLSFGGFYYAGEKPYALFNLNGNYKSLTCDLGYLDFTPVDGLDESKKCTVSFIVDGINVKEYAVSIDDLPRNVTVPINNGLQLKILISNYKSRLGIGNITVK